MTDRPSSDHRPTTDQALAISPAASPRITPSPTLAASSLPPPPTFSPLPAFARGSFLSIRAIYRRESCNAEKWPIRAESRLQGDLRSDEADPKRNGRVDESFLPLAGPLPSVALLCSCSAKIKDVGSQFSRRGQDLGPEIEASIRFNTNTYVKLMTRSRISKVPRRFLYSQFSSRARVYVADETRARRDLGTEGGREFGSRIS